MPGHKRWVLLANPLDYLPNPVGFEIFRRTSNDHWAPRCRYVELILNGDHKGLYLLSEQIRIDKNRVNIKSLKETDIIGDAVTGGYLISYDDTFDEEPKFRSAFFNMPVMIKSPDDDIVSEQLNYIQQYINDAELSLYDDNMFNNGDFYQYFDIASWIDYYFVEELWGAYELKRPRSVWLYKDRNGKLTAGPCWDMEQNYFHQQQLYCEKALYYQRFFLSDSFVKDMKQRWVGFRSNLLGNEKYNNIIQYIDSLYEVSKFAARRDRQMTPSAHNYHLPSKESTIDLEYNVMRNGIQSKIDWLENYIMSL